MGIKFHKKTDCITLVTQSVYLLIAPTVKSVAMLVGIPVDRIELLRGDAVSPVARCGSGGVNARVRAVTEQILNRQYDEIGMDAIAKMRNAQADRMVMDTLGDRWAQQQSVNIMSTLAEGVANGGGGSGLTEAGMGLGMGMAAGGMFGGMAQQMFAPMQQPMQPQAAPAPAQPQAAPEQDPMEVLSKLKKMLDMGLIEQSEYDAKKAEILSKM